MKQEAMIEVIRNTPQMVAVFRVSHVSPRLTRLGVVRGDLFYRYPSGCWVPLKSGCQWSTNLGHDQLEFVEYRDINGKGVTG